MNSVADQRPPLTRAELLATLVTVLLLLLCISSESFWIDEVTTATFASRPTWSEFWASLETTGSEMQMPLYSHYMWGWARVFVSGEMSLRCANIPWMVLLVAAMLLLLNQNRVSRAGILFLLSPLVCYQMNEARPYIMTLATSGFSLYALQSLVASARRESPPRSSHAWVLVLSLLACVATSMLNVFLLPALGAYAAVELHGQTGSFVRRHVRSLVVLAAGLGILLAYFAGTILGGHGGQKLPFTLTNFAYAIYEWLGFGGLGAPRNILREIGPRAAWAAHWPTLFLGTLAWTLVVLAVLASWRQSMSNRTNLALVLAGTAGALMLIGVAILAPASIWGRHFLFLWPICWVGLARWLLPPAGPRIGRVAMGALVLVFLLSAAQQRFDPAHAKDPYREAVKTLRDDMSSYQHLPWVWTAYPKALVLYGGEFIDRNDPRVADHSTGQVVMVLGDAWGLDRIQSWGAAHPEYLLLLHRPDATDPEGGWQAAAEARGSQLLWERGNIRIYLVGGPSGATE